MKKIISLLLTALILAMAMSVYAAEQAVPADLPYITSESVAFIDYSGSDDASGASASSAKKTFGTAYSAGAIGLLTNGGTLVASGKAYLPKSYTLPVTKTPLLITSTYAGEIYMNAEPIINPACAFKMASGAQFTIASDVIIDDIIIFQEHEVATAFVVKSGATLVIGDGVKSMTKTDVKVQIIVEDGGRAIIGGGDFDVVCNSGGEVVEGFTYEYLKVEQWVAIEEGDYGYYDVTDDGKIEIVDVLRVIKQVVDDKPNNGGLLRVIRALKLVTESKVIAPIITEIDTESQTVTLLFGSANEGDFFTVPMQKIGFDENYLLDFYLDGTVTMTVSGDFETSKDTSLVHAAKAFSKYDINEIHLTADSTTATLNGEEQTLYAPPIMKDGVLMVSADFLAEKLEAIASWNNTTMSANFNDEETELEMTLDSMTATLNGETVTLDAPMTTVDMRTYVPAAFVAEAFGAAATFYEDTSTLVIVKQFLPTLALTDATGAAGEEVSVTLSLLHNPGIAGLEIELGYDSSAVSYVSATTVSNGMYANASTEVGANPVKFVTAHLGLKNVEGDLTLATVNFAISEDPIVNNIVVSINDTQLCFVHNGEIYSMRAKMIPSVIRVTE